MLLACLLFSCSSVFYQFMRSVKEPRRVEGTTEPSSVREFGPLVNPDVTGKAKDVHPEGISRYQNLPTPTKTSLYLSVTKAQR